MSAAASILVSGLILGALYALMATGLSLVWSTLGIFSFAHGAILMLGAYVAWQVGVDWGFGAVAGLMAAIAVTALLGRGLERELVAPFSGHRDGVLLVVVTTLAAMTFLQNGALLVWGARLKQLEPFVAGTVPILGVAISAHEALIIVTAPLLLGALWLFLARTATGMGIRAVGQNADAARLLGLDVERLRGRAFALAAAFAGIAGVLLGAIRFVTPEMGTEPLTKALIVAIFGGLGSIGGTIGGAFVIGLLEALCVWLVGLYWTPAILFLVMSATLVVRPEGLFGGRR